MAGILYITSSVPGFFRLTHIPGALFAAGNAEATAANIAAHESLFLEIREVVEYEGM